MELNVRLSKYVVKKICQLSFVSPLSAVFTILFINRSNDFGSKGNINYFFAFKTQRFLRNGKGRVCQAARTAAV
jgi:hypothetical protein